MTSDLVCCLDDSCGIQQNTPHGRSSPESVHGGDQLVVTSTVMAYGTQQSALLHFLGLHVLPQRRLRLNWHLFYGGGRIGMGGLLPLAI